MPVISRLPPSCPSAVRTAISLERPARHGPSSPSAGTQVHEPCRDESVAHTADRGGSEGIRRQGGGAGRRGSPDRMAAGRPPTADTPPDGRQIPYAAGSDPISSLASPWVLRL